MTVNQSAFSTPAVWAPDDTGERGGRVFRKHSSMASTKPFDYSRARKWAPKVEFSDPSTFYPSEVENHGVRSQEELLGLFGKYFGLWQAKMPTSKKMQDAGRKNLLWGIFGTYQKDWRTPILPFAKNCQGGKLWDVDGNEYIDLQFGDTPLDVWPRRGKSRGQGGGGVATQCWHRPDDGHGGAGGRWPACTASGRSRRCGSGRGPGTRSRS